MMTRAMKSAFYHVAGPVMFLNGLRYRLVGAPRKGFHKVHLGPGQQKYMPGWINVDANMFTARCDVWSDLRHALPFHDCSIDAVYSHHVIEHLPDIPTHIRDVYRCLKSGGAYRIGVPNGDTAIRKFAEGDLSWFGDWPEKRRSIGGRLNNFILCKNEHLAIMTESYLRELLEDAGFSHIARFQAARDTGRPDLFADCLLREAEKDFDNPRTLIIEAVK